MLRFLFRSRLFRLAVLAAIGYAVVSLTISTVQASPSGRVGNFGMGLSPHLRLGYQGASQVLTTQEQMGVKFVREEIPWRDVEPAPGQFQWQWDTGNTYYDLDGYVAALKQHDMQMLAVLDTGPSFLPHHWPNQPVDTNQLVTAWDEYVQAAVQHFGRNITYWQVGDAPNRSSGWGRVLFPTAEQPTATPDPLLYTRMLNDAYTIIKTANPNSVVVLGGMSTPLQGECAVAPSDFLSQVWAAGGWRSFDVVAMDFYPGGVTPQDTWNFQADPLGSKCPSSFPAGTMVQQIQRVQDFISQAGAKPIWVTSIGWQTEGLNALADRMQSHPELAQADMLVQSYVTLLANPQVQNIFWYTLIDEPHRSGYALSLDGQQAYRNLSQALGGSRFIGQIQGMNFAAQGGDDTMEYRFQKNGQTNIVLWRATGGTMLRPATISGLTGRYVRAYPADALDPSAAATQLEVDENGNVSIDLNERPVIVVAEPANLFQSMGVNVQDRFHAAGTDIRMSLNQWAEAQKQALLLSLQDWLKGIENQILNTIQAKLDSINPFR
jgi:hypothetical protein